MLPLTRILLKCYNNIQAHRKHFAIRWIPPQTNTADGFFREGAAWLNDCS